MNQGLMWPMGGNDEAIRTFIWNNDLSYVQHRLFDPYLYHKGRTEMGNNASKSILLHSDVIA